MQEHGIGRYSKRGPLFLPKRRTVTFILEEPAQRLDSVDSILDKIDSELDGLLKTKIENSSHQQPALSLPDERRPAGHRRAQSSLCDYRTGNRYLISKTGAVDKFHGINLKKSNDMSKKISSHSMIKDKYYKPSSHTNDAVLPSISAKVAQDLNTKYTEILRNKQSTFGKKTAQSQFSDNNSVCTEDFEAVFKETAVDIEREANGDLRAADARLSTPLDTPRTEDFEEAFNSLKQAVAPGVVKGSGQADALTSKNKLKESDNQTAGSLICSSRQNANQRDMSDDDDIGSVTPTQRIIENPNYDASSESELDAEITKEIKEASVRIQKEIELERKANRLRQSQRKEISPSSVSSQGTTVHTKESENPPADTSVVHHLSNEKMKHLQEINRLRSAQKLLEQEVEVTELQLKDNRARAEEARSQMMLAEFKRDAALKEFTQLASDLERGRLLQDTIKSESQKHISAEIAKSALGMSAEELKNLKSERNQLKLQLESRNGSMQMEISELERQLSATKQELYSEQRKHRDLVDGLEEQIETLKLQLNQAAAEKNAQALEVENIRSKIDKLERQLKESEKTNLNAIIERDKELEILKETAQRDSYDLRIQLNNELSNAKKLIRQSEEKCCKLQQDVNHRDLLIQELREDATVFQSRVTEEKEADDAVIRELQKRIGSLELEKMHELQTLKHQMEIEHLGMLEASRNDMEQHQKEILATIKEEFNEQICQLQQLLYGKDEEICLLKSRLGQQEEAGRKLAERLKCDAQFHLEQAVQNERYIWEKEKKILENSQLKQYKDEVEKQIQALREELEAEQRRCRQLDDQYRVIKDELEEQRQSNQKLYQEKLAAVNKVKQSAQDDVQFQLEKMRQQMEEDTERVLDKLREELALKEEEVRCIRNECNTLQQTEADLMITLEKLEKLIVNEINDECRKTAHLLGVTPRKIQQTKQSPNRSNNNNDSHKRIRRITASAIANLRGCNEELRNTVKEVKEEVESLKAALRKTKKSKDAELEKLKGQLGKDKSNEMEELKHRLTQVPNGRMPTIDSHNSYLAKLEQELLDKSAQQSSRLSTVQVNGDHRAEPVDLGASPKLRNSVHERVRQLKAGSPAKRNLALSTPNLTEIAQDMPIITSSTTMEQRVKLAELKAHLAEERASRNQLMLNQKLQEVNNLQCALNSQTKEIISLERSLEDYRHPNFSSSKSLSLDES